MLTELVAGELSQPVSDAAHTLCGAIRERHGDAVRAVLFYGSCLRRKSDEGVLDFYVIVDDYRAAYGSRWLAALNRAVPPNVLWLVHGPEESALRCKYAVLTTADFERLCAPGGVDGRVWARFSQPAGIVWARDDETRRVLAAAIERAVVSMVSWMLPFMPEGSEGRLRFGAEELWRFAFRQTYRAEWRSESPETIASLYEAAPERFLRATAGALGRLGAEGAIADVRAEGGVFEATLPGGRARRRRLAWRLRQPLQKTLLVVALLKTAFTQDDWVSYVLWKLERHSGVHIESTEAQRRHPLTLGLPVLFRILRQGILR